MIKVVASFFLLMVMISAGTVYSLKQATEQLDARKQRLSADILKDRMAIKVLRAEMAYLSQPERLQKLSTRFLALLPTSSYQMATTLNSIAGREGAELASLPVDEFPMLLPREKPAFDKKKYNSSMVLAAFPLDKAGDQKKPKAKKPNFYQRISHKLEKDK